MRRWTPRLCVAVLAATAAGFARADELRNVKPGEAIPDFSLPALDGPDLGRAELEGKVAVLVFVSAQQRRSQAAAAGALSVSRGFPRDDLSLVFVTADAGRESYFRRQRTTAGLDEPLLLDADRRLYGDLGLVVLPTTIVIDPKWRLAHVISSHKPDYEHVLKAYAEHAMGRLDDAGLRDRLETATFRHEEPEQRIARHRAAARVLRKSGMVTEAVQELQAALAIEPGHTDTSLDLAAILIPAGRLDEARAIVDRVLVADPGHRRGQLIHGVLLFHEDRLDEAQRVLTEVMLRNPDPVLTHYYLGRVYERKGDLARAIEHYKQSLTRLLQDRSL